MSFAFLLAKSAEPSGSRIILTVSTQSAVNLIDKAQGETSILFIPCLSPKSEEVAHRKSIGPKVSPRTLSGRHETGVGREFQHHFRDACHGLLVFTRSKPVFRNS